MKTLEEMKKWYISAVKAQLILNFALLEEDAAKAVASYKLKEKLDKDPKEQLNNSIEGVAEDIARRQFIGRPCSLTYKGYVTEIKYDSKLKSLYGRIEGISEFISFEAPVPSAQGAPDIEQAFHQAVDDYLDFCADRGIAPETGMEDAFGGDAEEEDAWRRRHGIQSTTPRASIVSTEDNSEFLKNMSKDHVEKSVQATNSVEDSLSDIDLLKSFGIDPDEETIDAGVQEFDFMPSGHSEIDPYPEITSTGGAAKEKDYSSQVDARTGVRRKDLQNMESDQFLRFMGIDPDDVIL